MLNQYNDIQNEIQVYHQNIYEPKLNYAVSEIMESLAIENTDEINLAFSRAVQVCDVLHIPFDYHFKKLYRSDGKNLLIDWKISSLASYLIIVNCNPTNESVAKAQLYFALNKITKK